jgi:6-pyruvoyltetrahydropterin/6-carboxytetrahydropterin synthase
MYELIVEKSFSAAHNLREYEGVCAQMHGHNWKVQVVVDSAELNDTGFAIDFNLLDKIIQGVIARFDHTYINEVAPFDRINPTAENLARIIYQDTKGRLPQAIRLQEVKLWETESYSVTYRE